MSNNDDAFPSPDDSRTETVGRPSPTTSAWSEETIRTQVTDDDIRGRMPLRDGSGSVRPGR